jgi:hypothetical protein
MMFKSRIKRSKLRAFGLLCLGDLLVAGLILVLLEYTYFPGLGVYGAVVILAALECLSALLLIVRGCLNWLSFFLFDRKFMADLFFSAFQANHLPPADEFEDSPDDYIGKVVGNADCTLEARLGAAGLLGEISNLRSMIGCCANQRLSIALEDAVSRYRGSCAKSRTSAPV